MIYNMIFIDSLEVMDIQSLTLTAVVDARYSKLVCLVFCTDGLDHFLLGGLVEIETQKYAFYMKIKQ